MSQQALYEHFGANVKYVLDPEGKHTQDEGVLAQAITHIYGHIPGSGVNVDDELLVPTKNQMNDKGGTGYQSNGIVSSFDQGPFIDAAVAEHVERGGSPDVHHGLDRVRPGMYYIPPGCTEAGSNCKVALISHGWGVTATSFVRSYAPYAMLYDIVMVFPQGQIAWDYGDGGELYNTIDGVQPIFLETIARHIAGDHVVDTDVAGQCTTYEGAAGKPAKGNKPA